MTTIKRFKTILALALALPMTLSAQVDVNREKYPDYSDKTNPDWSLMQYAPMQKSAARTDAVPAAQRPAYVNNAELKFFPPVFNQDGGSCGSASRICYMFTYELNAYRNLNGKLAKNYYPSHFVWLHTNGNSGKDQFVTSIGVPSAATYGGQTYSSLFGYQDCADNDFGWMQGYDKWFEAMHNRMLKPANFPVSVGTEEGREAVKNWLWNHSGDTSFQAGGICGIGVASAGGNYDGSIPSTTANRNAGVVGKKYVKAWGTQVDHALTIVGYDDRIEFDLDGNGVAGEADKDEVGAWIIVNSWGTWWGNSGFIYCPYAFAGASFRSDGTFAQNWWAPEIYKVRKDYRPLRTIKLEMDYSRRSEIKLSAGISADINATAPERTVEFEHFRYAGDGNYGNTNPAPEIPMLGRWADGKLHTEPMEFGYDLTDLTAGYERSMPLKYFFIIETKSWGKGRGNIYNASIMDYEYNEEGTETPFTLPGGKTEIKSAGNKTIISVVVYGEPYYAPQNASLSGSTLKWEAPLPSTNRIEKYNIYKESTKIAEVSAETFSYDVSQAGTVDGSYSVTAVYEGGIESQKINVTAPIAFEEENAAVNFKKSGFKIPGIFDNKLENATIEFYIKPNSLVDWNQSAGPGWGTFMMHADASGNFYAGWDTNNRKITSSYLKVGKWTHVAVTVQGGKLTIYIDGQNRGSVTSTSYSGIGGFGDLVFSASGENNAQDASYDEIRIWNRARPIAEVRNGRKFQYSGDVMPDGLIAYYKGDLITVDGKQMLREYISGNHAEILNNNYEATTSTVTLTKPTSTLTASIDAVSSEVYAGMPIKLSATYSDAVAALKWTVEDAGLENVATLEPTVTFKTPGEQKVILVAEDSEGNSVTAETTVNVLPEKAIDATFHVSKDPVIMGEKVSFIIDNPAFGVMYEWEITGSETQKIYGMHASAAFNETGEQTVTLKASSFTGANSATSTINVYVLESEPVAAFEVSPAIIMKGEKTYLKDVSTFFPTEWEWVVESTDKTYVINGRNSSLTPSVCGVYNVTLNVRNEIGSGTTTRERALIVCNADSKNGLGFGENAKVTAPFSTGRRDVLTVEWWMRPTQLTEKCLGIGQSEATFLINANTQGVMSLYANGYAGNSQPGFVIANEWHHYAAILDCGFVDFYRDGKYVSTSYVSTNAYIPELSTLAIGTDAAKMSGQIDEFRVWSSVVKDDALLAVCNAPIEDPAAYSDLMLYYDFNQAGGDVIDRTGNGHDGVRSGFGPDGDAWGLSRGVFCLNTEPMPETGEVTGTYLKNYQMAFTTDNGKIINPNSTTKRFYAIKDWTLENTTVSGDVTTGAHVDNQKNNCMTFTTTWDGFGILKDHKAYQTVTLPAGNYTFTAEYHDTWEGQCGNSYILAAEGEGLPNTANLDDAIAYTKMLEKDKAMSNSVRFSLAEETTVSLGLLVNIDGKQCMAIKKFILTTDNTEYIDANGETVTSIECIEEVETANGKLKGIYDLSGRKLEQITQPGIYIIDGKKALIK
ncbi:MAG: DUF5013 domain-containing protein [Bacteroidaceae bacterium]|nr:DUF5013 domain-containing protein [Bacteroidaceae bacterium]MBP3564790.1 DUF5013 domain-containing protein [Alistipes sp.]